MKLGAIHGFRLVTADLDRLVAFYRAIGFAPGEFTPITDMEMRLLELSGSGHRQSLTLGASRIELDWFEIQGRPYPAQANAADLVFQHFALVSDDAQAAWQSAAAAGASPISLNGAVELPQASGGVTAVKFRDPDGHPLEFLQFPTGANPIWTGNGMMGIDHSAISVSDIAASQRFYSDCGLTRGKMTCNQGPTQVALDGLDEARVDVVAMNPSTVTPHVELLGYRAPIGQPHVLLKANDTAATRIVWRAEANGLLRDPDGHFHQLTRQDP